MDLGKKFGSLDFGGGVICNFGFGLRGKVGSLDLGGVICNFGFGLRGKVGSFDFGGVICNFGFGLREKVGRLDFRGGGNLQLRIWT